MAKKNKTTDETTVKTFVNPETPEQAREVTVSDTIFARTYLVPIAAQGKKLRELIQEAAMQTLYRAFGNDNFDYINKLHGVISDNLSQADAKKFKVWIEKYSPTVQRLTKKGKSFRKDTSESANPFDFVSAVENPWFMVNMSTDDEVNAKIQAIFSLINVDKSIDSLIKKIEKQLEADNVEAQDIPSVRLRLAALKETLTLVPANQRKAKEQTTEQAEAA